jgi:hypothetical protein
MSKLNGFFVEHENKYVGPFISLKEARSQARKLGSDKKIFHGNLKYITEDVIDNSELFLIPKIKKG